ncbi:hypothetical protein APQ04_24015 [Salmonella enterica]|nr:hypothetical protein [Salmonella enterica]EBP8178041.1 hypothetical protein [Salmonella enterica]EDS0772160.1 hypothetical protein [Salmonella enterica]
MDVIGTTRSALAPDLHRNAQKGSFSQVKAPSFYVADLLLKSRFSLGRDFMAKALFFHFLCRQV